jgi:hypothetical protein
MVNTSILGLTGLSDVTLWPLLTFDTIVVSPILRRLVEPFGRVTVVLSSAARTYMATYWNGFVLIGDGLALSSPTGETKFLPYMVVSKTYCELQGEGHKKSEWLGGLHDTDR